MSSNTGTIDINSWLSLDLSKRGQEQVFMRQLVQYLHDQYIYDTNLVTLLNGANLLSAGAFIVNTQALGSKTTAFTFDCKNALISMFSFTQSGAYKVTLANLPVGALVFIAMTFGGTHTLTFGASTPAGTAFTAITLDYASVTSGGGNINMITPGTTFPAALNNTMMMVGFAMAGPVLNLICQ